MFRSIHLLGTPSWRPALLLLVIGCLGNPVHAAAQSESSGGTETPAEGGTPPTGGTSSEVFIPTEEISEDFAVAFPVDI